MLSCRAEKQRKGKSPTSRAARTNINQNHWNGTTEPSPNSFLVLVCMLSIVCKLSCIPRTNFLLFATDTMFTLSCFLHLRHRCACTSSIDETNSRWNGQKPSILLHAGIVSCAQPSQIARLHKTHQHSATHLRNPWQASSLDPYNSSQFATL
jgi:hypothetical protein